MDSDAVLVFHRWGAHRREVTEKPVVCNTLIAFEDSFRERLADYADLQAEHQRLSTSPHDHASREAHDLRRYEHFRRVQFALGQLRQKFKPDRPH